MDGMSINWKPGDVAMDPDSGIALVVPHHFSGCPKYHADAGLHIHYADGDWNSLTYAGDQMRPLVIIDPEDREQVRSLLETYGRQFTAWTPELDRNVTKLQAALREFANPTPPRPEEPTGLGAVVEDADGGQYVLVTGDDEYPWAKVPAGEWQVECFAWHEFEAVRVLSEGVRDV